ncbi:MAG: hypothetical protein H6563_01495 [Lewinellaceae bacterium]|nr:hypothetical protein [Lewinellaceae bacterium]
MKKNLLFVLFSLLLCPIALQAQDRPADLKQNEPFIYLRNNTLLREGDYEIKPGFLSKRFFYPNGEKISLTDIKYFQDEKGYYSISPGGYGTAKRIEPGTMDLFIKYDYSSEGTIKKYYYAKGFGDAKLVNYKNLEQDLVLSSERAYRSQNELIQGYLKKGKTNSIIRWSVFGGGMATFFTGMAIYGGDKGPDDSSVKKTGLIVSLVGIVTAGVSLTINSEKSYLKALREYNKVY